jgi:transposase
VAAHLRSHARGHHTTDPAHMPKAHLAHREWSPSRLIAWARTVGPQTAALVEAILASRPHPEQGYRSCLGILRLAKRDGPTRLEAACARALAVGARSVPARRGDLEARAGSGAAPRHRSGAPPPGPRPAARARLLPVSGGAPWGEGKERQRCPRAMERSHRC